MCVVGLGGRKVGAVEQQLDGRRLKGGIDVDTRRASSFILNIVSPALSHRIGDEQRE